MSQGKTSYSKEFKIEAVQMVIDSNRRISDVAKELGLRSNLLGIWKKRYEFIKQFREAFPVVLMCKVGCSGFYAWLSRAESPLIEENKRLVVRETTGCSFDARS